MALLWRKQTSAKTYEVRTAGASVRLYTNGVFHSQFNERQPITGNLWNMLALPALLHSRPQALRRVLVLGVGGGAVLRHIHQLAPQATIIGVDLDSNHLRIARRFFLLKGPSIELVHGEAVGWLTQYSGPPFDLIIDDLFGETRDTQRLPQRAVPVDAQWLKLLHQHLARSGVVAFNLEDVPSSEDVRRRVKQAQLPFAQSIRITHEQYHNAVLTLLPRQLRQADVRESLMLEPKYRQWQQRGTLPYQFNLRVY